MGEKIVLNYFDVSGKGDPIRLALTVAGVEFEDKRYKFENWKDLKPNRAKFPLAVLPTLEIGDRILTQSLAILRYIANKHNLHGSDNDQRYLVDMLLDTADELLVKAARGIMAKDEKVKEEATKAALEMGKCALSYIDQTFGERGTTYAAGDKVTVADFSLINCLKTYKMIEPDVLEKYPNIKKQYDAVHEIEAVKKFYKL